MSNEINPNRIARVKNNKIHSTIEYVSRLTDTNYQYVFDNCEPKTLLKAR